MRGVTLVLNVQVELGEFEQPLRLRFPNVCLHHDDTSAEIEDQPDGAMNRLVVDNGQDHVEFLDRPTTIQEYEEDEILNIRQLVGEPKKFFATSYTGQNLLKEVLQVITSQDRCKDILVDDEYGNFLPLKEYINMIK